MLHTLFFWLARQQDNTDLSSPGSLGLMSHHHSNSSDVVGGSPTDMPTHVMLSNIAGSLSILCWFIVFTPQLYINYKRKSGESLSLPFLYIWLAGDFLNVAGATLDNLLLTMRILAWYYTIADILLIAQVYYYRRTSVRSSFESVIAANTNANAHHPERRPASTKSSSSSSSSASSSSEGDESDNEHKSLLGASSNTIGNNYLTVAPVPVSGAGTGAGASSSWTSSLSTSPSPSGGISFSQEQEQHQLTRDRIRYQAAQAANSTAAASSSSNKCLQDQGSGLTSPTASHCRTGRRASEALSTRTTASERFRFLQKRRSVRQWTLIILPILASVFFIWSFVEWRECVLGEVGDGNRGEDGSVPGEGDGIGNADKWWGWTECGRGHGRGSLPPAPNPPPTTPSSDILAWEKGGNRTIVQLMSSDTNAPLPPTHRRHRHRKSKDSPNNSSEDGNWMALLFGWGSAALYLGSRIPQLYKNWRLKSCEGLSIMMFLFSVFGNALFVASILLNSLDRTYLIRNMPWWLGSTGTLIFDFSIFSQFYLYRHNQPLNDALQEAVDTGELAPEATQALLSEQDYEDAEQNQKHKASSSSSV
ncbi:hypothetical protein BGZ95_007358 [Linnemannia exigua]|uniref:PQ-loop-domain-containing protein n=1 Tax=Linnemannia exigua TaxID=604196 RepID=A0AAD4DHC6_9FUNG|nr:hypothetical protein BGZ95_007358 [Linnemannia exigua]